MISLLWLIFFYVVATLSKRHFDDPSASLGNKQFQFQEQNCIRSYYSGDKLDGNFSDDQINDVGCVFANSIFEKIYLDNNKLEGLSPCAFTNSSSLNLLMLSQNNLKQYSVGAFHGLTSLHALYLNKNELTTLHKHSFKDLNQLHTLTLSDNELQDCSPEAFDGLTSLRLLHLNNNKLKILRSHSFKDLHLLNTLTLSDNGLQHFDVGTFNGLTSLRALHIGNNKQSYERLTTVHNYNVEVDWDSPNGFRRKESTTRGSKNHNFRKLKEHSLNDLHVLNVLNLSYNELDSMDGYVPEVALHLSVFDLSNNEIKSISIDLMLRQNALEELYLGHNSIQAFDSDLFRNLSNLRVLDLSHNPLKSIDMTSLSKHYILEELYLNNVNMETSHFDFAGDPLHLKILDLSGNQLTEEGTNRIRVNTISRIMNMSNNRFSRLPPILSSLTNSAKLDLSNNDMHEVKIAKMIKAEELIMRRGFVSAVNLSCLLHAFPLTKTMLISSTLEYPYDPSYMNFDCSYVSTSSDLMALTAQSIQLANMSFVKEMFFHKLEKLDLAHNMIQGIPANITRYLPALTYLDLSYNNVSQCISSQLTPLIKKLILFDHPVITFEAKKSSGFALDPNVVLIVNTSDIGAVKAFGQGTRLTSLRLINNNIKCLCDIRLSEYKISALYADHGEIASTEGLTITGVTEMDLSFNKLESFEYRIGGGDNPNSHTLTRLNLAGNNLKHLNFSSVAYSLIMLNVDQNMLETIDLTRMPSLKVFKAVNNRIKQIDVVDMTSIRVIRLDSNMIDYVCVRNSSKLKVLNLNDNSITDCNDVDIRVVLKTSLYLALKQNAVRYCRNLHQNVQKFTIKGHQLDTLKSLFPDTEIMDDLHLLSSTNSLRSLDLSNGLISTIDRNAFRDCGKLEELFLNKNMLKHITWLVFAPLQKLRVLSLTGNKLKFVTPPTINLQLSTLTVLNLAYNLINQFDIREISHLPNLTLLYLNNNKLRRFLYPVPTVFDDTEGSAKSGPTISLKRQNHTSSVNLRSLKMINISDNLLTSLQLSIYIYQKLSPRSLVTNPLTSVGVVFGENFSEAMLGDPLFSYWSMDLERGRRTIIQPYVYGNCITAVDCCIAIKNVISLTNLIDVYVARKYMIPPESGDILFWHYCS